MCEGGACCDAVVEGGACCNAVVEGGACCDAVVEGGACHGCDAVVAAREGDAASIGGTVECYVAD